MVKREKQDKEYAENKLLEIQTFCSCNKHFLTYFKGVKSTDLSSHSAVKRLAMALLRLKTAKKNRSVLQTIINAKVRTFPGGCIFLKQQLNCILRFAPENCAFDSCLHK